MIYIEIHGINMNDWLSLIMAIGVVQILRYSDNTQMSCCDLPSICGSIAWNSRGLRGYRAGLVHPHLVRAVPDQVVLANIRILTISSVPRTWIIN